MNHSISLDEIGYPEIKKSLLLAFSGYVFIWYLQIGIRMPVLGSIRFEFIYAFLLTLASVLFTPKINIKSPLLFYALLYFIVIAIQIPFSYDFDKSFLVFVDRIIKFAFMAFFIVSFVRSPTGLKYFLAAFLLACLKMGQEGVIGRISGNLIWENQGIMRLHGSTPMYVHPNSFSGMALGTLPFVYYLWPLGNKYVKLFLLLILLSAVNIIVFTASRTGYVGLVVFLLTILYRSKRKIKTMLAIIVIITIALPVIPHDYIDRFNSIFTEQDKEGRSIDTRKQIISDAVQIFKEHPFGVGISAFPRVRMARFERSQDTHNLYLEIATNLGIQGVIVFTLLIVKMLVLLKSVDKSAGRHIAMLRSSDGVRDCDKLRDLKLIQSVTLATISFIFIRLGLGLFGMDLYEIYWWFAIGLTLALFAMMCQFEKDFTQPLNQTL